MVVTCRELMNGVSLAGNVTAYLDALDEYRSGGDRKDKVQQIGIAMAAAGLERWRLTCRAEDWRAAADLTAITRASAAGLWRSRAAPPDDAPDLVPIEQLPLEPAPARATLDTALFRGRTMFFEPIHRTIAEFFAGATIARAIAGSREDAAFPLSRALALISAPDGKAPSELRGLYAWFAAHLARQGDEAGARRPSCHWRSDDARCWSRDGNHRAKHERQAAQRRSRRLIRRCESSERLFFRDCTGRCRSPRAAP